MLVSWSYWSTMLAGSPSRNMLLQIFIQTSPPTFPRAKLAMECGLEVGRNTQVKILTRSSLSHWTTPVDPICPLCNQANETVNRIFLSCPFAQSVWALFPSLVITTQRPTDVNTWFWHMHFPPNRSMEIYVFLYLWKNMSNYIFQSHPVNPFHVHSKASNALVEWHLSHLYTGTGTGGHTKLVVPPTPGVA